MSLRKDEISRSSHNEVEGGATVISSRSLASAIQRSFVKRRREGGIENSVAQEMADHVLNFFGYGERIIDNMLRVDDRDIFYMLEDLGILKTEREETTLYDGREWRINYWTMKKGYIESLINGAGYGSKTLEVQEEDPYKDLPDDLWRRGDESF
ncbi:MAG: hypothetical protein QCI82_08005 [Candidatus Thermoplasmatota archaeon]|nr:hypothetical protein [Candidatus Thermoplasmatota archaeon]